MAMTSAYKSIDDIVISWLGKREYPIHYYVKAMFYAAEAIQELSLTSGAMIQHALLTKETDENWYALPSDYEEYVRVGARFGDTWFPVRVSERLMPFPNRDGLGDMNPNEFGPDMNTQGNKISWYAGRTKPADFNPADFSAADMKTTQTSVPQIVNNPAPPTPTYLSDGWACYDYPYGGYTSRYGLGVAFDPAHGVIMAPAGFAFNELYLVYVGNGTVDQMTEIPIIWQSTIEAYIDWKYAANKRNISVGEAADWERKYHDQHRLARARQQHWQIEDIISAFEDRFVREVPTTINTTTSSTTSVVAQTGYPYSYPMTYGQ